MMVLSDKNLGKNQKHGSKKISLTFVFINVGVDIALLVKNVFTQIIFHRILHMSYNNILLITLNK